VGVAVGQPGGCCRLKSRRGVAVGQPRKWCRLKSRRGMAVGQPRRECRLKSRRGVAVGQPRRECRLKRRRGVTVLWCEKGTPFACCVSLVLLYFLCNNVLAVRSPARVRRSVRKNGERAVRMNNLLALRVAGSLYFRPFVSSFFLIGRVGFGASGPRH
jgi:hypothetical protein